MAFPASHTFVDEEQREGAADAQKQTNEEDVDDHHGSPLRFLPLRHVYSATSPCLSSKKIKARRPIFNVYSRRPKLCPDRPSPNKPSFFDSLLEKFNDGSKKRPAAAISVKSEPFDEGLGDTVAHDGDLRDKKRRRVGSSELSKLGIDSSTLCCSGPRLRESRNLQNVYKINSANSKREKSNSSVNCKNEDDLHLRKWVRLAFDGVDPMVLIGMQCKVYWPLDADWYKGSILAFDRQSNTHNIKYEDGDEEDLILPHEKIKIHITREEMQKLNLHQNDRTMDDDDLDYGELVVLAASFDDCRELEPGDIIWAKLTGHAMWPAVIVDESHVGNRKGLRKCSGGKSLPVQFFGTHDFARIQVKQISSFLKGLLSSFHLKCRSPRFLRSLKEAKVYLNEQKLPKNMLHLQCESRASDHGCQSSDDERSVGSDTACIGDEGIHSVLNGLGDLQIISLGKVASDFQDEGNVWPVGYTAVRRFTSIRDPSASVFYKMEILRDPETKVRPMFKVTVDGEQFRGATPSACWNKIFNRMRRNEGGAEMIYESGSEMFGFNNPEVLKLIQDLTSSKISNKISGYKPLSERYQTYRPVRIDWKDHDRCSVCHMDEEYENNLFLQCDKCRIMVHARCYGEEYVDGVLWLCNLCRSGAPESTPPCCLCPVIGGALKPTTDGRWAHLACAIWIPETCLSDIKRMEPIDGLNRINKDRWKLLCSICGVPYGACIQCSNNSCRVAYHPLCARAAGLCVELEDEDRLHLISFDEDEENQCIRLLSFCKKHRQPSNEHPKVDELIGQRFIQCADYIPPPNPSGCARTEPYDYLGRRGRKEPEAISAASVKRLFVENRPYLVGGYCLHESLTHESSDNDVLMGSKFFHYSQKQSLQNASAGILSMAEKFKHMRITFRKRLAFGKSRIHGFGIFAKQPHKAGDMVIEYTGEIVRPTVADRREHLIYNSLVGAGTYMFRIDNERVLDATRSGSIAHLINHSCEPNCYSRVITVNGEEHIIIFAKRDIRQWEELTYDYRFFSIDEQLACCCGFPRCRGVVNDVEAEEQAAKLYAPRSELIDWRGE